MCSAMIKAAAGDDLTTLRDKTFAAFRNECRLNKDQHDESNSCSFSTVASKPPTFKFILKPLSMPFRLDFAVKIERGASLALAESTTHGSIFAEMNIGGQNNRRSAVRSCYNVECHDAVATHDEAGLVDANEYRPFWIEYKGGVVRVGKGGQEEAFLEWDAGAHHQRVATQVRIGIASWAKANGDWVFYKFCA
ncbi:C3 and PZP-like alpha-2-macroglobulin domain-containing protein 8 [Patiria miniata]|uniref:Farnesoic acid O-methyl transferase domain-containing protein n=1 Tax=Patiria miniata TaxID=46514 RepID=A0A914AT02_PATMI|nr:C3 and PZP-like alpha-2-macroglobulin domain-containing protein 8 [Patiria miniata]